MPGGSQEIVVVGAGCIGSVLAARLATTGHQVSLVARGQRRAQIVREGLQVRHRVTRRLRRFDLPVHDSLQAAPQADTVVVAVQQHQLAGLLPDLTAHPASRVVLALNYTKPQDELKRVLGDRVVWAFPAVLAALSDGVIDYVVLPWVLAPAQVTTVGPVAGASTVEARAVAALLRGSRIPSIVHDDMYGWLLSHAALMAPIMAAGVVSLESRGVVDIGRPVAVRIARAQREGFAAVRAAGQRVTPKNVAALAALPGTAVGLGLWVGLATPAGRAALRGHADHGAGEVSEMLADLTRLGADHHVPMPVLLSLQEEFEGIRRGGE